MVPGPQPQSPELARPIIGPHTALMPTYRQMPPVFSLLAAWAWAGCGPEQGGSLADADFFAQHTALECALRLTCNKAAFSQRFDSEEDCLERLNQGEYCEVVDDEQAGLCLAVMESMACSELDADGELPSLPNCDAAVTCGDLN